MKLYVKPAVTLTHTISAAGNDSQTDSAQHSVMYNIQDSSYRFSSTCTASAVKTESWRQAYAAQSLHPAPLQVPAEAAQSPVERPADDSNIENNGSAQKHIVRTKASCVIECLHVHDIFMGGTLGTLLMWCLVTADVAQCNLRHALGSLHSTLLHLVESR